MHRRARVVVAVAVAVLATPGLGGCSGGGSGGSEDPAAVLATAKEKFAAARTVTIALTSTGFPAKVNGVASVEGQGIIDAAEPKFKGTVTGTINGVSGTVGLLTIGADAYLKFFTEDYTKTDLTTMGAPNPSTYFDPKGGIAALLSGLERPVKGDRIREGKDVLRQYSGTLPGKAFKELFFIGDGATPIATTYGIADDGTLRLATFKGPFYGRTEMTYTLRLKDFGAPVEITRP